MPQNGSSDQPAILLSQRRGHQRVIKTMQDALAHGLIQSGD
jgi:hypothetical protein